MTHSTLRTRIAAVACTLLLVVAAMAAMSTTAAAQVGCCPTYSVTVANTVPATCFPITFGTRWSNGIGATTTHTAPGTITVPAPVIPGCWQSPPVGISINGVGIPLPAALPPCLAPITIGTCTYTICFVRTATGCYDFVIR